MKQVLGLIALLSLGARAAGERAAMITAVAGKARLALAGKPAVAAEVLTMLPVGAHLTVQSGTVSLVYTVGGRKEKLSGPCEVEIGAGGGKLVSGPPTALVAQETARAVTALPQGENLEKLGGTLGRGLLKLTMGQALTGPPIFAWEATDPQATPPYQVEVKRAGQSVWVGQTSSTQLAYAGPALQDDVRYTWEVKVAGGQQSGAEPGHFRILSRATQDALAQARAQAEADHAQDPQDPTPYVMLLRPLVDNDLLAEAVQVARKAAAIREDPGIYRALERLYYELGQDQAAEEAQRKAKELRAQQAAP